MRVETLTKLLLSLLVTGESGSQDLKADIAQAVLVVYLIKDDWASMHNLIWLDNASSMPHVFQGRLQKGGIRRSKSSIGPLQPSGEPTPRNFAVDYAAN